jgi:DNA-binding transcriptional ArsR family regulator
VTDSNDDTSRADPVEPPARRKVDASSLQGLAHPLRVQLCDQLGIHGPATATQLAARLGESSGATSYHLRQLEKYGFVEDDPTRGSRRERWWRRVRGGITISSHELAESEATRDATHLVLNEFNRSKQARIEQWRNTYDQWPREWIDASVEGSAHLRVNAAELSEFTAELDRLITSWVERTQDRQGGDFHDVEAQTFVFPVGPPTMPTATEESSAPSPTDDSTMRESSNP